jgi:hypothetical protein
MSAALTSERPRLKPLGFCGVNGSAEAENVSTGVSCYLLAFADLALAALPETAASAFSSCS